MKAPAYTTDILRLAASLAPPAVLTREDGRAGLRSPTCGSTIRTSVMVEDGRIAGLSQEVRACAFGQATAALVARHAVGRSRDEIERALGDLTAWLGGEDAGPSAWPELAILSPAQSKSGRHGAILLPFRALLAALDHAR